MLQLASESEASTLGFVHRREVSPDPTAPLGLLVHGRAGDSGAMSIFRRAFPGPASFFMPEAHEPDELGGFHWWRSFDESWIEKAGQAARQLQAFTTAAISLYGLRPRSIIAVGFSQGAAVLSAQLQLAPEALMGAALLCGFVAPQPLRPLLSSHPPIFLFHGSRDEVVSVGNAHRTEIFFRERGHDVQLVLEETGHKVGPLGMRSLSLWVGSLVNQRHRED